MLEVTEKILASIHAMPMSYGEISALPYLKTISDYGISYSIERLIKDDYIIEKFTKPLKKCKVGEVVRTAYRCTKKGERYLIEHGYLQ
jgi:hypothetical protein